MSINNLLTLLVLAVLAGACGNVKQKTKEAINEGGEVVGKAGTEFIEGVSEGVDKTLQCSMVVSQPLKDKGIGTGKFSINNNTTGGENNLLTLYIIFDKDFEGDVWAKAFDKTDLEAGRSKVHINGKAGEAKYYDFAFDKRTYIEVKSKIVIE
jgi:hypothetical protein